MITRRGKGHTSKQALGTEMVIVMLLIIAKNVETLKCSLVVEFG